LLFGDGRWKAGGETFKPEGKRRDELPVPERGDRVGALLETLGGIWKKGREQTDSLIELTHETGGNKEKGNGYRDEKKREGKKPKHWRDPGVGSVN